MTPPIPMSITKVTPGLLARHIYTPEITLVLRTEWNAVEVLTWRGATVRWGMESFRRCYEVISEAR